jgi:HD-like signal output (HDOD) protein
MQITMEQLIRSVGNVPPLPQAAHKALALVRDPESNISDLARVIALDQVMAGLVLRWANSAYYSVGHQVSTVHQALIMLGMSTTGNLILSKMMYGVMDKALPGYELERGQLWRRSVGTATGAQLLASRFGTKVADEAYHAGLLCDIGKLAIEMLLREQDLDQPDWQKGAFDHAETEHFGLDHAEVGGLIARHWQLPESLIDAIANHHKPNLAAQNLKVVSAVHVSDAAMMILGQELGADGLRYELDPVAVECLNFREQDMERLCMDMMAQLSKIYNMLDD